MGKDPDSEKNTTTVYPFRRHLTIIQAQTELLLEDTEELSSDRQDALRRIQRVSAELNGLVELTQTATGAEHTQAVPTVSAPETVHRILVCSTNSYLSELLADDPSYCNGIEVVHTESADDAVDALRSQSFEYVLVDAMWPETTGIDLVGNLSNTEKEIPPYVLVSLYSDATTPIALALSGVISPTISSDQFDQAVQPFVETPATIAGFFTEHPGDVIAERINTDSEMIIGDAREVETKLTENEVEADVICLDPDVYRRLSASDIGRLRMVSPGTGRPLLAVAPTDVDPYDRSWIPTLGSRRFLHRPPDLTDLITQLLAQHPIPPTTSFDCL
ncbi:DNA-binding transcriptional response regulator [Halopenitus persicus]|uniref:Response regulator receiver domain-containing protein n=1 Tax=Halopenitus persicus TaxID=1048396 RepID=A0A1H3M563_9EURY|nr:response regulator [Halopenitus persicus]SDY71434.1 Response regulator receiver domain-containing protein [Halopenitus persicus]